MNLQSLTRRLFARAFKPRTKPFRKNPLGHPLESLEDRSVPATLVWVGDVNSDWNTDIAGDTNWSGDVLPASGDTLIFDGTGTGFSLNNDTAAGNAYALQFSADGYTINGDSITLDQSATGTAFAIQLTTGQSFVNTPVALGDAANSIDVQFPGGPTPLLTLGGVVSGGAGNALVKTSGGQLNLTNAGNTYDGQTTIDGGSLVPTSDGALGTAAGGTVANFGGTLVLANMSYSTAEPLVLNGGTLWASTGANTFGGAITLAADSFIFGDANLTLINTVDTDATGPVAGAALRIIPETNSAGIAFQQAVGATRPLSAIIQDANVGTLTFHQNVTLGAGTTTFNESVSLIGPLTFASDGSVTFGDAATDTLTISGGLVTLSQGAGTATYNAATTLTSNVEFTGPGSFNIPGDLSGAGAVAKSGAGTLALGGTNTYGGVTTIDGGTLLVNGSIGSNVTVNSSGTLGGGGTINGTVDGAGTVAPGNSPGVLTINGDFTPTGTLAFEVNPPSNFAGTDFDRIVVNGGDVDLSGATLTFSGSAGAVASNKKVRIIDNTTPGKNTTASASPAEGATVGINGNNYRIFYNSGTNKNDVVLVLAGTPTTVYVDDGFAGSANGDDIPDADFGTTGNQDATFGIDAFATINDALAAVSASGTIIVNDGTYAEAVSLTGTRTLRITGPDAPSAVTFNNLAASAATTVEIQSASTLTVGDPTSTTVSGAMTGSGSFVKVGAGTLTLGGTGILYTGATSVQGGTLELRNNGNLGGQGFRSNITLSNNSTVRLTATTGLTSDLRGNIGGTGSVVKGGTGIVRIGTFAGLPSLTYTGETTVEAGTLELQGQAAGRGFDTPGNLVVDLGATVTLTGLAAQSAANAARFGGLSGQGAIIGAFGTPFLEFGANTAVFGGTIDDVPGVTLSLLKTGAGVQSLTGANTYIGTTAVNNGRLLVNGSITSNTTVTAPGTLGGNGTITGNVTGTGTVAPGNSPGTLHIAGDFTPLGIVAFEVNPPAATPGTDYDTIEVTGNVNLAGATLTFAGTGVFPNFLTTIIDNQGANPTVASVSPAEVVPPAAATVTINGVNYFIFYNGGDGNDVVLVDSSTPTNVFVNDDWAALSNGTLIADVDPLVAGPQSGVKGVTAFGDIAPALAVVAAGGTVEVLGNSAAGYGGFTLSNAATFVLARDTFFVGGQDTVTINGAINLAGQDFTPTLNQGAGLVNLRTTGGAPITGTSGTPSVAVTTTVANTGSASIGGTISAVLAVALGGAGTSLDAITLGTVSTGTGGITTFSNGITTLTGNLSTDSGAVSLTAAGGVRTGASIAIDTEQGDDSNGGSVDLSAASVSSTVAGSNFIINTGTGFAGGTGGTANLGGFTNVGGHFIQDLTIDTSATTRGDITLGAAAQIGLDLVATGKNIVSNATFTAGGAAANTIDLDATGDVTDGNGTSLNFVVPLGKLSIDYTTGTVELDSTMANFLAAGDGNLTVRETDSINLQGVNFGATRTFDLTTGAGGTVTQDQAVVGGRFRLTSGGVATLGHANNDVDTFAGNVNGTLFLNDVDALTIGTVAGTATTDGLTTNGNNLTLQTGGLLTIGDTTGGTDHITAANSIVDLNTTAGGVLEANGAAITSASVRLLGTGTQFDLANQNAIDTLAANTTGGAVRFNNGTRNLIIGSVTLNAVTTDGITTAGQDATLASGALDVAQVVDASTGTARFTTQGGVTQTAVITAVGLGVNNTAGGNVDLNGATNQITAFAANTTTGFVDILSGLALTIGSVTADAPLFAAVNGITTTGGNVTVTTVLAGSTLAVNSTIASNGGDIRLDTSAGQTLAANIAAVAGDITLTAAAGGVNQTAGGATGTDITLGGVGAFNLNSMSNDSTGVFAASVTGALIFRDANDLTLRNVANAVSTGGNNATIYAGEDFTAMSAGVVLVNAGAGVVRIVPGAGAAPTTATTFTYNAGVIGSSVTFGSDPADPAPDNSTASTKFRVAAVGNTVITVFGSNPVLAQVGPTILGDSITPFLDDPLIKTVSLVLDPFNPNTTLSGTYTITMQDNSVRLLKFRQIESLGDLGYRAIVAQTGNMQYSIRLQLSQPTPFPGSVTGQALQSSPFVVSPNILNVANTYTAPTVAFGNVNNDGVADLIIANGSNDTPQVTVIDGLALFTGQALNLGSLPPGAVIARFYAFVDAQGQPTFRGGLHVAVKSNGANTPADIVLGPGPGGGPAVQTYRLINGVMTLTSSFFAFESSFRGGVTVAAGDYDNDGLDDIIVGTGPGGGPRVQVFKSGASNSQIANFFAYDGGFRGGVFVAAGNFDGAGGDDIATAPGYGGGPHVRVFKYAGFPQEIASFFAWNPSTTNGLQTSGTNANNGIGSISFGAPIRTGPGITDGSGRQEILVGSNRGTALQLRRFTFAPGATVPLQSYANPLNLFNELTMPGATDEFGVILNGIPILDPMTGLPLYEAQLFDGGSVSGFAS